MNLPFIPSFHFVDGQVLHRAVSCRSQEAGQDLSMQQVVQEIPAEVNQKEAGFKALHSSIAHPILCLMTVLLLIRTVCEGLVSGQQLPIIPGHTPEARSFPFHRWGQTQDRSLAECGEAGIPAPGYLYGAAIQRAYFSLCDLCGVGHDLLRLTSGWGADTVEMGGGWLSLLQEGWGMYACFLPDILAEIVKPKTGISRLPLLFS